MKVSAELFASHFFYEFGVYDSMNFALEMYKLKYYLSDCSKPVLW